MRNSPTPSTGAFDAFGEDSRVGDVGEQLDRHAVGGHRGPVQRASSSRSLRSAATRSPRHGLVGSDLDLAARHRPPARACRPCRSQRTGDADDAGDAELAGDDRGVAGRAALLGDQGDDEGGVEAGGVGRARGPRRPGPTARSGVGTPGSGSPTRWAVIRRSMSRRSVTRSAISPPIWANMPAKCSTAASHRVQQGVPAGQVLAHRRAQSLVAGQRGARGQHLGGRTGGGAGPLGEAVGDRLRRGVVRREAVLGVGRVGRTARSAAGSISVRATQHRAERESGHDRGAVQRRGGASMWP